MFSSTKRLCLFILGILIFISSNTFALDLVFETCTLGAEQYRPNLIDDCLTSTRTCCKGKSINGLKTLNSWGEWDEVCPLVLPDPDMEFTYRCRIVPSSYCTGASSYRCMSSPEGDVSPGCTTRGEYCYTTGGGKTVGGNSFCKQCRCDMVPEPPCNCSGTQSSSCSIITNMYSHVGYKQCVGGCLWGECTQNANQGEYCGLELGAKYYCTPAAYPENGGYQACEYDYIEGQSKIGTCNSCGPEACLIGNNINGGIKDSSLRCQARGRMSGSNDIGNYTCVPNRCNIGYGWSVSGCTDRTYTSCTKEGYTLVNGNCSGGVGPIKPGEWEEPIKIIF